MTKPGHIEAVDEAFGPPGEGPFPPTYRTEGGSTRPVIHSEEAAVDRDQAERLMNLEGKPLC